LEYLSDKVSIIKSLNQGIEFPGYTKTPFEVNYYEKQRLFFNRFNYVNAISNYLIPDFFGLVDIIVSYVENPFFLYRLVKSVHPVLEGIDAGKLEIAKKILLTLVKKLNDIISRGNYVLACDLLDYIQKLATDCLKSEIKLTGCKMAVDSEEFLFTYVNLRKFLTKSQLENPNPLISQLIPKENIDGLRAYSKFCSTFYKTLYDAIISNQGKINYSPIRAINRKLKDLYGIGFKIHDLHKINDEDFKYNQPLGEIIANENSENIVTNLLNQKTFLPYLLYRLFSHKSHNNRKPIIPALERILTNHSLNSLKLIFQKCPIIRPKILYKITEMMKDDINEKVIELWTIYLEKLKVCINSSANIKNIVKLMFELRQNQGISKSEGKEKEMRLALKINVNENTDILHYALIDNKYGYIINHIRKARYSDQLISKYKLPQDILTVELGHPYRKARIIEPQLIARNDLEISDWLYYDCGKKPEIIPKPKPEKKGKKDKKPAKKEDKKTRRRKGRLHVKEKKVHKEHKDKEPLYRKYVKDFRFRITFPLLELAKTDDNLPNEINIESIILGMKENHKKYFYS